MATYLYAITRPVAAAPVSDLRGVAGAPVRAISDGDLGCLVSSVSLEEFGEDALARNLNDLAWLERTARAHDAVVQAAAQIVTTAPLRMATVCLSDDAALRRLRALGPQAAAALDRVQGRVEWGVKAFAAAVGQPDAADPGDAASGTDYLQRRRRATEDRQHAASDAAAAATTVYEALRGLAVDARTHRPQPPQLSGIAEPMLLNAAYLVERGQAEEFAATARRTAAAHTGTLRVVLTGPWPPYSFAAVDQP